MDWLNYHHLLYFWTVAREGGLRKASEKLRVSQPSISAQVRALEAALGEKLFQRKGRSLALTETGRFAYGYAEEIFSLGSEFLSSVRSQESARKRPARFTVGIEDSFPKQLSFEILRPVFELEPRVQVVCREGKAEDLVGQLANHRLDAVLADEPATGSTKFKVFSELLGRSVVAVCAPARLAKRLQPGFPRSLREAPMLLPTPNTTLRRSLDEWFLASGFTPTVVAEFEDAALMKIAAANGEGVIAVPSVTIDECVRRFNLVVIGTLKSCSDSFFLITAERRTPHPALTLIAERARAMVFR